MGKRVPGELREVLCFAATGAAAHLVVAAFVAAVTFAAFAAPPLRLHRQHGAELSRFRRDGRRLVRAGRLHGQPLRRLRTFRDLR